MSANWLSEIDCGGIYAKKKKQEKNLLEGDSFELAFDSSSVVVM